MILVGQDMAREDIRIVRLATGRTAVATPMAAAKCRLRRPRAELPLVAIVDCSKLFELPFAEPLSRQFHVEAIDVDGVVTIAGTIQCTPGLARPSNNDQEKEAVVTSGLLDAIDELVNFHVERCQEVIFPSRAANARTPNRVQGMTRASWEEMRGVYWQQEDGDEPLRLIVRIAEECSPLLGSICDQPRRILRRVRERARLDRVQRMDDACIRWFVRQPGRTVLEKAGPQRRVMSVQRVESADTLENRVVRDFLERSLRASTSYLRDHDHRIQSERVRIVRKFRGRLLRWLKHSEISGVPLPVGSPSPNYVLQFDDRYAPLWFWYERLRRQQQSSEEAWRWRSAVFTEHCSMAIAEALSRIEEQPRTEKRVYLRTEHDRGRFVDIRSLAGVWTPPVGNNEDRIFLTHSAEFPTVAQIILPPWRMETTADMIVTCWRGKGRDAQSNYMLVYCLLPHDESELRVARQTMTNIVARLNRLQIPESVSAATMIFNGGLDSSVPMYQPFAVTSGRRACSIELPLPGKHDSCSMLDALRHCRILPAI